MPNTECRPDVPGFLETCLNELGSVTAVSFIEDSIVFDDSNDITDPANWVGHAYAADIIIHKEVRGSYPPSAPTEVAGKGKNDVKVVGRKHELTFRKSFIKGNDNHINTINKATNYTVAFVIGGDYDMLFYVNKNVSISAVPDVQEGLDTEVDWVFTVKWSDIDVPSTSDVPAGIFDPES